MKAYICVYRNFAPDEVHRRRTSEAAASDPNLRRFLTDYADGFFDWGDDPSFFSAQTFIGDVCHATWGVCRPNVRQRLTVDDMVIFFCAKQDARRRHVWDYHYIGVGTVAQVVKHRKKIWTENQYKPYRRFYNVLAQLRGNVLVRNESFHPGHQKDWKHRCQAPYVLFMSDRSKTNFNLTNPLHVATYNGDQIPERWNRQGRELERLLFIDRHLSRRLRTSHIGSAHPHIKLSATVGRELGDLREALLRISERSAN